MVSDARTMRILSWPRDSDGWRFDPDTGLRCWLHPTVRLSATASLADQTILHAGAVVAGDVSLGPRCTVGTGARIGMACTLGADIIVGDATVLAPRCTLGAGVRLGDHCRVAADSILADHCHVDAGVRIGRHVRLGHGCRLGAASAVHAGARLPDYYVLPPGYVYRMNLYKITPAGRQRTSGARRRNTTSVAY